MMLIFHSPFKTLSWLLLPITLLFSNTIAADHKIYYSGFLSGKAVLRINKSTRHLSPGKTINGVKLLSFNKREAIVRVHGIRYRYEMKSKSGIPLADEVIIPLTNIYGNESYAVECFINGKRAPCMVDTGAATVSMSLKDAKRLKIKFNKRDKVVVGLAGGKTADGWGATLDSVRVGDIEIKDVPAMIVDSRESDWVLLGMSFLKELEMSQSGGKMVLKYNSP
jgi:aspartyl protease family protein